MTVGGTGSTGTGTLGATSGAFAGTLTNLTTGETCTLNVPVVAVGTVIVIDALAEQVTVNGVPTMSVFDGLFPRFVPGANTLKVQWTAQPLASVGASWQNRWW